MSKPGVFAPWASSAAPGDISTPLTGQQAAGFTPTIAAPPYQWMNWVLNWLGQVSSYLMERGVPDYDATQQYVQGDTVQLYGGGAVPTVYQYINTSPATGVPPLLPANSAYWQVFGTNWLPAAISSPLATLWASSLPSSLSTAILSMLGLSVTTGTWEGGPAATLSLRGIQIVWQKLTFPNAGGYPTDLSISWFTPFVGTPAVLVTSNFDTESVSVLSANSSGAVIRPTIITSGSPPATLYGSVVAFGVTS